MKKVMVAMSGGVDSSAAAVLLSREGYSVVGGTLRLYEKDGIPSAEIDKAKEVCDKLSIEHFVFDKRQLFKERVIDTFSNEYENGLTPNPCIECNKYIKFGALLDEAIAQGCSYIATGHYSKIKAFGGRRLITRAADGKKDQTYVLWSLTKNQLDRILMPLGDYTKDEVRQLVAELDLSCKNSKESQDICFVPDGDYAAFLEGYNNKPFEKGQYYDINGKYLGENLGHQRYTIGQRKGLGIALGRPQFVISKDPLLNRVVLGDEELLFQKRIYVKDVNIQAFDFYEDFSCTAKLRYSARDTECRVHITGENEAVLEFKEPQRAAAAGQSAVFYDGEILLGGGKIVRGE